MTRAPWTRWTDEQLADLRRLAGRHTAEEIGTKLGRTVEQVRGAARRHGINLKGGAYVRNWTVIRQSRAGKAAWADPDKRARMLNGIRGRAA